MEINVDLHKSKSSIDGLVMEFTVCLTLDMSYLCGHAGGDGTWLSGP